MDKDYKIKATDGLVNLLSHLQLEHTTRSNLGHWGAVRNIREVMLQVANELKNIIQDKELRK